MGNQPRPAAPPPPLHRLSPDPVPLGLCCSQLSALFLSALSEPLTWPFQGCRTRFVICCCWAWGLGLGCGRARQRGGNSFFYCSFSNVHTAYTPPTHPRTSPYYPCKPPLASRSLTSGLMSSLSPELPAPRGHGCPLGNEPRRR